MQIETKLDIMDNCYFLHNNKIVQSKVIHISIHIVRIGPPFREEDVFIKYRVDFNPPGSSDKYLELEEKNIFLTKELLKESL